MGDVSGNRDKLGKGFTVSMWHHHNKTWLRRRGRAFRKEHPMLDVIMLVLGLGFFAVTVAYAYVCDRL
jgi:hypothetical protein